MIRPSLLLAALAGAAPALADEPGDFDYYVLALSWSPTWCAIEGEAEGAAQCDRPLGWTLHGLWPQHERGWPSDCRSAFPDPTRAEAAAMVDIMGSAGLARHQWRRHGTCTGLSPRDYLRLSRLAYEDAAIPDAFERLPDAVALPAALVEEAFLRENPDLVADGVTVTCEAGRIQEVRLCLTRELEPRACAPDARRDCAQDDAIMEPVR